MTTLVTGAAGFVGRHVAARIAGAVPLTRADADLRAALPSLPRVDTVIHCAAEIDDQSAMQETNVGGTERLVTWARGTGVRTFVFISTGGIHLANRYAETKREAEQIVLAAHNALDVHVARLFFPYGPGQSSERLIPRLIARVRSGQPITIGADGGPALSLTYISDVVEAIVRIAVLQGSHVVDVGGLAVTMREIATVIGTLAAVPPVFAIGGRSSDLVADRATLAKLTGFSPSIPIEEGLRSCVD